MIEKLRHKWSALPLPVQKAARRLLVLVLLVLITAVIIILFTDLPTPAEIQTKAKTYGLTGYLLLIPILLLLHLTIISSAVVGVICGVLFGPVFGLVIALTLITLAPVMQLITSRVIGGQKINQHLKGRAKRIDALIKERGYLPIMYIRLFAVPSTIINYSTGTTKLKINQMAIGSFLGAAPRTIVCVLVGNNLNNLTNPAVIISIILWLAVLGYGLYHGRSMLRQIQTAWSVDEGQQDGRII